MRLAKLKPKSAGQALVEFSLILPLLLLVTFAIIDYGRILMVYAMSSNSLRNAVRLAEVRGYPGAQPTYLQCGDMADAADDVFFANSISVDVRYIKEDGTEIPCASNGAVDDSALVSGDMLRINSQAEIEFMTPFLSSWFSSYTMDFTAQRTVVKQVNFIQDKNDTDYDGLPDDWEREHFDGDITAHTALDDPDGDGCNNGCELSRDLDPNNADTDDDNLEDGDEIDCGADPSKPDTDEDGLTDDIECEEGSDPREPDTDGDGLQDGYEYAENPYKTYMDDVDSDDDTLSDYDEIFVHGTHPMLKDTDGDDIHDNVELSGYSFTLEVTKGGITTTNPVTVTTNPTLEDTDADGVWDGAEIDGSTGYVTDPTNDDTDDDGLSDGEEIVDYNTDPTKDDTDEDGLLDGDEIEVWGSDPNKTDTDDDGLPDYDEVVDYGSDPTLVDSDGDGLTDYEEVMVTGTNPTNPDSDDDSVNDGDEADNPGTEDTDGDGLWDWWEEDNFNGDLTAFSGLDDPDGDMCSMMCEMYRQTKWNEADTDGDDLIDGAEIYQHLTDPLDPDTDGDGINDGAEVNPPKGANFSSDPKRVDTDDDGLTDYEEVNATYGYESYPNDPDSDDDRLMDDEEVEDTQVTLEYRMLGGGTMRYTIYVTTDPLLPDTDDDGLSDYAELNGPIYVTHPKDADSDNDGIEDGDELLNRDLTITLHEGTAEETTVTLTVSTNPLHVDTDGDGLSDGDEFNGYTVPLVIDNQPASKTVKTDPTNPDTDGDDADTSYDLRDGSEVNGVTRDGETFILDPTSNDTDLDGLTDAAELDDPEEDPTVKAQTCVIGISDDSDTDGLPDCLESDIGTDPLVSDTDGDGITDGEEHLGFDLSITVNDEPYERQDLTTDPLDFDTDDDGINDGDELTGAETGYQTDPTVADTDGDGINDGDEPSTSNGHVTDPTHYDTDSDYISDGDEINNRFGYGTANPNDGSDLTRMENSQNPSTFVDDVMFHYLAGHDQATYVDLLYPTANDFYHFLVEVGPDAVNNGGQTDASVLEDAINEIAPGAQVGNYQNKDSNISVELTLEMWMRLALSEDSRVGRIFSQPQS